MRFSSGFNLPPGCRESDIPGYHDIDVDINFYCDPCEEWWTECVTVDERGCEDVEAACPKCSTKVLVDYEPSPYDDYEWCF